MIFFASAVEIAHEGEGSAPGAGVPSLERPTFPKLYADHFDSVWCSARRMGVAEESLDDVVQEVFVAAYQRLPSFEGRSTLKSWLLGITVHCVQRHRRTARRKTPHTLDRGAPIDPETLRSTEEGPHDLAVRAEAARVVQELLEELDEDKRTVFVLAEFEKLTAPEIARILDAPTNTVYSRLRHARQEFAAAAARHRARDRRAGP